ncbi:MAG TPA: EAL domain-containing protein [Burkholderiales bacterium]|nr:EAL domain-containing protein [Burkholderiales bacterium]
MVGSYNYWMVFLSVVVAILASYTALNLATRITASKDAVARAWLIGGAISMGVGIWSMHFIGMLAFSLPIPLGYDVPVTLLSMLIAILVSGFALYVVSRATLGWRRLLVAGALMGGGICAMHYTGMAAMKMDPGIHYNPVLFGASVVIAVVASLAALWIAFTLRANSSWMRLAKLGSAVVMGFAITGMHYTGMAAAEFAEGSICLSSPLTDFNWMAGTIAALTAIILCVTLGLSILDARMASKTAKMVESLRRANDELQHLALHDALTRLPNRLLLEDRLNQALVQAQRSGVGCAVMFVDLDRFKTINDSLGHFVGDELLRAVAARLLSLVREEDTVSRLGGDEFVILLKEITSEGATVVADKVLKTLGQAFRIHSHELIVTPSIGISLFPAHGNTVQALLTQADAAMYSAKQRGRNNVQVFAADMNISFPGKLKLETDLRRALERREFVLHYQPKVDMRFGRVVGMEALLRWNHPERGVIPPNEFIPLAEETGLIVPIGRWVVEEACRQTRAWHKKGLDKLRVAVNISAVQFRQKDLLDIVTRALTAAGLAPEYLEVEITESTVMENASDAVTTLERLARAGVRISIDDFGTGYSSLAYLKSFPIDTLKIDRSFIREISEDRDDAAIVRAIIGLAHNLRLKVVAEGVETEQQLHFLRSLESDEYQGYFCSRPLSAADFERYMRETGASHLRLAAQS